MKWDCAIGGQPPSVNHTYKMGRLAVRRKGHPVLHEDGSQKFITRPVKTEEAKRYQQDAQLVLQAAKPSRWTPNGQLRVVFDLYLGRDEDADNVLKLLLDALSRAIDYDDKYFLPCINSKVSGERRPYVLVTVEDAE